MAMIMQGGETLKLIGYTHIQDTHDETEETHPTYILVSSYSAADKIYTAKKGDTFQQVGVIGYRDPNDRYSFESHKTYIQVPKERVNPKTKLTRDESTLPYGTGEIFLDAMKKYLKEGGKL